MKKIDAFLTEIGHFLSSSRISTEASDLQFFAQDWSKTLTPRASAVVFPESTDEVSRILKCANHHEVEIVPSGGRTGLSGGAVATRGEVVLSLIRMNTIGPIHEGALTLKVGAGAITEAVHRFCEPHGLVWPVDFASKGSSTVGGNIATNAGGIRVIRYGNTRNWVLGITAVGMDGTIHHFNSELEKNNTGYDLRQLLIGSEGTLCVITEATLKLCPLPRSTSVLLFSLSSFPKLLELFQLCRKRFPGLSAFECLDHASMESVRKHFSIPLPVTIPGAVYALIEIEHAAGESGLDAIQAPLEEILGSGLTLDAVIAQNEKEARGLWQYREGVAESILHDSVVHQEDVSVPVARLPDFYSTIEDRYARTLPGFGVFFFGHIGDGNLHIFIRKPAEMTENEFWTRAKNADRELFRVVQDHAGSVSAEHGIGLLKKHAIHFSRSPGELKLLEGIKKVFDPKGLLNPEKVIPDTGN
jgi:FAD/FMN-containing dehydrogenase